MGIWGLIWVVCFCCCLQDLGFLVVRGENGDGRGVRGEGDERHADRAGLGGEHRALRHHQHGSRVWLLSLDDASVRDFLFRFFDLFVIVIAIIW